MSAQSVTLLIDLLHRGDDTLAQDALWQRYFDDLARRVSQRLGRRFCGAADEEDVALSAMDSFFRGMQDGRFPDLAGRKELWNLLLTIAYRKVIKLRKRETCMKRGGGAVHNETSLSPTGSDESFSRLEAISFGPSEDEVAVAVEEITEDLGDPILRTIAVRRLQGYTDKEIAQALGVTERTVIRKRQRIQAIWQDQLNE
jgi:DNA-directed RNA polymerase specialized sigma24 family protein